MMGITMVQTALLSLKWSKLDILAFAVVAVIFAPLIWWTADRNPPIELINYGSFPEKVVPGQTIYRNITLNRLRLCETDPDTIIVDGANVRWAYEEPPILRPGNIGKDTYSRPVVIPMQASPGKAEMRTSATFVCNPLHRLWPIVMVNEPLKFEIVPPENSKNGK